MKLESLPHRVVGRVRHNQGRAGKCSEAGSPKKSGAKKEEEEKGEEEKEEEKEGRPRVVVFDFHGITTPTTAGSKLRM